MPRGPGVRRWRWLARAGLSLAVLAGTHYVWFTVFGPPARWGTGVVGVDPRIEKGGALASSDEPAPDGAGTLAARLGAVALDGVAGKPFELDVSEDDGMAVLQTHAGASWTEGQRLYLRAGRSAPWREVLLAPGLMLSDACLVQPGGGRPAVLTSAWQPWWPYERHYGRLVRSLLDPPRRAEYALYLLDLETGALQYLAPGQDVTLSPDRRLAAYVTSENDHAGFHTIRVWVAPTGASIPVLSLWETDPGSGRSFGYRWSRSSATLRIDGATQGFSRWGGAQHRALHLAYRLDENRLVDIGP